MNENCSNNICKRNTILCFKSQKKPMTLKNTTPSISNTHFTFKNSLVQLLHHPLISFKGNKYKNESFPLTGKAKFCVMYLLY